MQYKNKYKILLLIFLIAIIIVISIYIIHSNFIYISQEKYYKISDRKEIIDIIKKNHNNDKIPFNIKINNQSAYYNELENTYYYYYDTESFNKEEKFNLKIITDNNSNKNINFIINSNNYKKKRRIKVTYDDDINVLVYNNKSYDEFKIKFINLPLLNITYEQDVEINTTPQSSTITLYSNDVNTKKNNIITSNSLIRTRGGISILYPKKSYRLSLIKNDNKNKISLLGMRTDEDWILDSLYSEQSFIRSKLSYDLWNQINSTGTTVINNDINTEYVVVYMNNEYLGLYLLKEPVDKKTLNLNNDSILIKGITYTDFVYPATEITEPYYGPYELKLPNNITNYDFYWRKILDKMKPYFIDNEINDSVIENSFNPNNYIDYKIFVYLIKAVDNYSHKNLYLSLENLDEDTKLIFTPWDLDMTYGLIWTGKLPTYLEEIYDQYDNELYLFNENTPKLNIKIKDRYLELRKTVLSNENINKLIDNYKKDLEIGEASRNHDKWINASLDEEVEKVRDFFFKRIEVFDKYVGDYDV